MPRTQDTSTRITLSTQCRWARLAWTLIPVMALACSGNPDRQTLAQLREREPDLAEVQLKDGIDQAMAGYRKFLEEAPKSALTPEAMRRLADLKLEKEYGALEAHEESQDSTDNLPKPDQADIAETAGRPTVQKDASLVAAHGTESDRDFERRAAESSAGDYLRDSESFALPVERAESSAGPLEAIELYDQILEAYPNYAQNDQVLYQKARAYDELGRVDEAIAVAALLVAKFPESRHLDEIQFRRAEYFFTRKKFFDAEKAYGAIVTHGPSSDYYELALYKLGWTLYKQMMLEEAIESYVTLLDHKVSTGYDFDQPEDDADEQRISDTYRVISLCFSDLGGAETVTAFFDANGQRSYEDRVYQHLGEFYLEKRRYNDAATVYEAFVGLYPIHGSSPHFSMRVVEIYEEGNFPKLVLDSKKAFASRYGLESDYWQHFTTEDVPEVISYLKGNLKDLANHYHALYQSTERPEDKPAHFAESALWYRTFLSSFPAEPESPEINYQLADLLLENDNFSLAAGEYERIAYDYPDHARSASAGYAAIFAHREHEKRAEEAEREGVRREAVASTLRFVDRFPEHEHAAAVLGAAIDDLYSLEDHPFAIATGQRLIEEYPASDPAIRRSAWLVIAHASFATESFEPSEQAYARVLELTQPEHESRQEIMNNLAAAIYKQGELASDREEHQSAADHFLRIAEAAPLSEIRPIAEYDAGAALIRLEDWAGAAGVLEAFRTSFPEHELNREATRQIAFVYREDENPSRAAEEYERVAAEAEDLELRREALLVAGDLYEKAELLDRALAVLGGYVAEFKSPIEAAVATRFKMAELHQKTNNESQRYAELRAIVAIDRDAGESRTDGIRVFAAKSALILSEDHYRDFADVALTQPFEKSLQEKQRRMDSAITAFGNLVDYEVGEVTAAATFYIAEVYAEFSRALLESERPMDLEAAELDDYEMVLEENAYPFEEKSIDVHEKNLELMDAGVFNEWIEKSLARLAVVIPGRYAKFEASSGLLSSPRTYAYQTPSALLPVMLAEEPSLIEETPDATQPQPDAPEDPIPESLVANEDDATNASETDLPPEVPAAPAPDWMAEDPAILSDGLSDGVSNDYSE
jgi:TolA-binding protein